MASASPNIDIVLKGEEVKDSEFISVVVERDMFQPDIAAITLSNKNDIFSGKYKIGDPCEVKFGTGGPPVFAGEIIGFEGLYKGGETTRLTIRAANRMHRLLRKRESITYKEMNDQEMITKALEGSELSLEFEHKKPIKYDLVYRHNLTALEFIRMRAARIGCYVWCVDKTLHVKEPDFSKAGPIKLSADKDGNLRTFMPRLNSATVTKKVTVQGWDPEKKEKITGSADQKPSGLGSRDCVAASTLKMEENFTVDLPIATKEEADVLAAARLRDLNMQYVTGEAEMNGSHEAELGTVCEITANASDPADAFNGKYYIVGITHRHTNPKSKDGGQISILKVARDGEGA
ncbi:MAG TPA: contractile injection system protein, VgrG/Pvc8 family [Kofleriaceae bacterium]